MQEESKVKTENNEDKSSEGVAQDAFEKRADTYLPQIVQDLRLKNAHKIDAKAMK